MTNQKNNGTIQTSFEYGYNPDGNIGKVVESVNNEKRTISYEYDKQGRLKKETDNMYGDKAYTYDNYGNRKSKTDGNNLTNYVYDRNNRLITESTTGDAIDRVSNYSYDPVGNMLYKAVEIYSDTANGDEEFSLGDAEFDLESAGATHYSYDNYNRLKTVQADGMRAKYGYDVQGRRTSKTVNGETTNQICDGMNIVAETKGQEVSARYYRGIEMISEEREGMTSYYQLNGYGDVVGQTDTSANLIKTYQYDAFGNQMNKNEGDQNPFRYCGEYTDNETGTIYLRNRNYSPTTGRFTQEDPIKDGSNWYAYCGNDPINYVDPLGLAKREDQTEYVMGTAVTPQAASYINYYSNKLQKEVKSNSGKPNDNEEYLNNFDYLSKTIDLIIQLDDEGLFNNIEALNNGEEPDFSYNILNVPIQDQFSIDTNGAPNNYCAPTCSSMMAAHYLGDDKSRIKEIARSKGTLSENSPSKWLSTELVGTAQSQGFYRAVVDLKTIKKRVDRGDPTPVLYYNTPNNQGHWVLIVGYVNVANNNFIVYNDPSGGIQRIKDYKNFDKYDNMIWDSSAY